MNNLIKNSKKTFHDPVGPKGPDFSEYPISDMKLLRFRKALEEDNNELIKRIKNDEQ